MGWMSDYDIPPKFAEFWVLKRTSDFQTVSADCTSPVCVATREGNIMRLWHQLKARLINGYKWDLLTYGVPDILYVAANMLILHIYCCPCMIYAWRTCMGLITYSPKVQAGSVHSPVTSFHIIIQQWAEVRLNVRINDVTEISLTEKGILVCRNRKLFQIHFGESVLPHW